MFSDGSVANASHERDASVGRVNWEVVMRDSVDGPPPLGNDGSFCSRKVYFGSRASYDALERDGANAQTTSNWRRPPRGASGMVGLEAWIGPVPCNGGGSR